MRLTSVEIEGFRAITRLRIELRDVTVLIGEHNSGKSTVLDALEACLGFHNTDPVMDVRAEDFCRDQSRTDPAPRMAVTLEFEETDRSEWNDGPFLRYADRGDSAGLRRVRFRAEARLNESGQIDRRVRIFDADAASPEDVMHAWAALRASMPVLHLRSNRYVNADAVDSTHPPQDASDDRVLSETFLDMCRAHGRVSSHELQEAIDRAESMLENIPADLIRAPSNGRRSLDTIDRPRSALSRLAGGIREYRPGTGAQAAGVFLLMSMILDARGPRALAPGTMPIVLIEEPEAHLHPIVASMSWGLLEGLRAQVVATSYSSEIVASTPLQSLRRLIRKGDAIEVREVSEKTLEPEELRRVSYHVRVKRGGSLFARCWVLIEGETEGWLLPELANLCGYSLPAEGVECIEFAQCGIEPLVKTADAMGIAWHLLADGDSSGRGYASTVREMLHGRSHRKHLTALRPRDIEHFLFLSGYAHVYRNGAGLTGKSGEKPERAGSVIRRAIKSSSKPQMALRVIEAMAHAGPDGVPPVLRTLIETVVAMARAESDGV